MGCERWRQAMVMATATAMGQAEVLSVIHRFNVECPTLDWDDQL